MVSFNEVNARLGETQARWSARQTPQSLLSDQEKRALLGVVVDRASLETAMAPSRLAAASAANFAPAVDWRNRNGNHVTTVKDQGGCGSCVSFCTVAVVESMASIERKQSLNLSEADLHFCSSHGASCGGWWPDQAYDQIKVRGVINETDFSYMNAFDSPPKIDPNTNLWIPHCVNASNRASAVKITNSSTLANVVDRKNYLTNTGPCSAVLHVFGDFYSYGGGVYQHVTGTDAGLHCVEVIGYSEAEQCWIIKNSWGTGWGENGFGKIAYGEAGIDTEFPFWTASGVQMPGPKMTVTAAWQPVGGDEIQVYDWKYADYRKKYDELWSQGWRLHLLDNRVINNEVRYTAVWRRSTSGEIQVYEWSYQDYRKKYDELWNQGWRLHILNNFIVNGQVLYTAVWRPSNSGEIQVYEWSYQDYRKKYDELWNQGWRLHILNNFVVNGQVRYTAVWRPSTSGEIQVYEWAYQDYRKKYDELWNQGWRLHILNNFIANGQVRYTAVWRPSTSGEIQVYEWSYQDYRQKYDELWNQGWRLQIINTY